MPQKLTSRSPNLQTILMVEDFIKENSAEFNTTNLWKSLPRKVMWQTFKIIIAYLQSINKIAIDNAGKVGYIWDEVTAEKFSTRRRIEV